MSKTSNESQAARSCSPSRQGSWLGSLVRIKYVEQPTTYSRRLRWSITILLAAASLCDPMSYAILYPALPQVPIDLHTTEAKANLASTLSLIGPAIMPLYWGSIAERRGRRITCLASVFLFTLFAGLAGAMQQIEGLIVMRVLGSFCSCGVTVVGGAVVADIWEIRERGSAMGIYYLGPYAAPSLGPVLGGALVYAWDWRAVQWFLTLYGATVLVSLLFFLPETLRRPSPPQGHGSNETSVPNVAVATTPSPHNSKLWTSKFRSTCRCIFLEIIGPLKTLSLLRYPSISLTIYLASTSFAALIITATSIQNTFFHQPYQYNYLIIGLLYLPMPIGLVPAGLIGGKWSDRIMDRQARARAQEEQRVNVAEVSISDAAIAAGEGRLDSPAVVHRPEDRLRENAWVSVLLLPGTLVFYGWTVQYGLFWFVPMIPWLLMGFATGLIFSLVTTMVTEFNPPRSATMVALNSLGRNLFAAIGGSVTQPLIDSIGNGWMCTGCAVIALGNIIVVAVFCKYGCAWRERVDKDLGLVRVAECGACPPSHGDMELVEANTAGIGPTSDVLVASDKARLDLPVHEHGKFEVELNTLEV